MQKKRQRDDDKPVIDFSAPLTRSQYDLLRYVPTQWSFGDPYAADPYLIMSIARYAQDAGWMVYCEPIRYRPIWLPYWVPGTQGFPHLLLLRPPRAIAAYMSEHPEREVDPATKEWLQAFRKLGFECYSWNLQDWKSFKIQRILSDDRSASGKGGQSKAKSAKT